MQERGSIYGTVAISQGGTATGTIGDGFWCTSQTGIQPGHLRNDFIAVMSDVTLPSPWNPQLAPLPGTVGGVTYDYVLTTADSLFGSMIMNTRGIYIQERVRIYFTGDFRILGSASITLAPGATLEMYLGGLVELGGQGIINQTRLAANCTVFGLPTSTSIKYAANGGFIGQIYSPQADLVM